MKCQKCLSLVCAASLLAGMLLGCKPTEVEESSASMQTLQSTAGEDAVQKFQQTFQNGFQVDATYQKPKGVDFNAMPVQPVVPQNFLLAEDKLLNLLMPGQTVSKKQEFTDSVAMVDGTYMQSIQLNLKNGAQINADNQGNVAVTTPLGESISYAYEDPLYDGSAEESDARSYTKTELASYPKQKAVRAAKQLVTDLKVDCGDAVRVVALDHETLQKLERDPQKVSVKSTNEKKKGTWTENDECYAIYFQQSVSGLPVVNRHVSHAEAGCVCSNIRILYGKQGLVDLYITALQKGSDKPTTTKVCSVQTAMQAITENFKDTQLSGKQTLNEIALKYAERETSITQWKFSLKPIWEATIYDESGKYSSKVYVDAETGKLL
ncbi:MULTISPECIES: hypothetical protein [Caproicibacterium]|uniref:Lipoprotein n=1 Tax=Caproicibacterium argilliputei TaxID=3030016 RepID=A0AA97DCI3_9FIRM|nr:hypothetical protein [Caproicibacterium argilliputei]WOC33097.1 hypothetical protein PXC00_04245 [Caproicibacterium argilliputei]